MSQTELTEFEIGVKNGEFLGEIIIGLLVISGSGSAIAGVISGCKGASRAVNFVAKTYKRVNYSPEQLFDDSINAINDTF